MKMIPRSKACLFLLPDKQRKDNPRHREFPHTTDTPPSLAQQIVWPLPDWKGDHRASEDIIEPFSKVYTRCRTQPRAPVQGSGLSDKMEIGVEQLDQNYLDEEKITKVFSRLMINPLL